MFERMKQKCGEASISCDGVHCIDKHYMARDAPDHFLALLNGTRCGTLSGLVFGFGLEPTSTLNGEMQEGLR